MNKSNQTETKRENGKESNIAKWAIHFKGMDVENIRMGFLNNLEYNLAKDKFSVTSYDEYLSLAYTIRERLIERWIMTRQQYHKQNVKRIYYLSMEFLMGRLLTNNMLNLGLGDASRQAIKDLGMDMEDILDHECDAGLGNGGLGRLAACFLDSMATLELPTVGYGIRYEFGIFNQKIINGYQVEFPEQWLEVTNPWLIEWPEYKVFIKYFGKTVYHTNP